MRAGYGRVLLLFWLIEARQLLTAFAQDPFEGRAWHVEVALTIAHHSTIIQPFTNASAKMEECIKCQRIFNLDAVRIPRHRSLPPVRQNHRVPRSRAAACDKL